MCRTAMLPCHACCAGFCNLKISPIAYWQPPALSAYSAENAIKSSGCTRMTSLVYALSTSPRLGGTLI